jgi:hypothetical protein
MAGTIECRAGVRWSAASWLFDWVLRELAAQVSNAELAGQLIGIADENLGWLDLRELPADQRAELERVFRSGELQRSARVLPHGGAGEVDRLVNTVCA